MILPELYELDTSRRMVNVFAGLDMRPKISDGAWSAMRNMSTQRYPIAGVRRGRTKFKTLDAPQGMLAKDALAWVDNNRLYYNGYEITGVNLQESNADRQIVSMGAYMVIFPDGVYVNTADLSDCGYLDNEVTTTGTVNFTLCRADGSDYGNVTTADIAPENPSNGDYWLDVSETKHVLKTWSESSGVWVSVPTTYVRIEAAGIGVGFKDGDGIELSGLNSEGVSDLNRSYALQKVDTNYIIIPAIIDQSASQDDPVTVSRKAPAMDYVIESNNRLWGCRYGVEDGKPINEIYACKLGDFKNWRYYTGTAMDSYAVSLGSDGVFTGAAVLQGRPLFFKENVIHQVYGDFPSNYQLLTTAARGIRKGASKSAQVVNEVLYYQSREDICAFDGSLPVSVSEEFGGVRYKNGVGGRRGGLYYISAQDDNGVWHLLCYDTQKQMWCEESEWSNSSNVGVLHFTAIDSDMLMLLSDGSLISTTGAYTPPTETGDIVVAEGNVRWYAETGNIGYQQIDQKYISRLVFRLHMPKGTSCKVMVQYDSSGDWEMAGQVDGYGLQSTVFPIIPVRCDHMKIRIEGRGDVALYNIAYVLEQGSDVT